ncbi:MAG TPA: tubulin-like doman-containing protein [Thermoanaerobaculia bacterium]|nr:tubulin-like doman-containing protein [Thermoanaerobaculia bacterium]
MPYDLLAVGGTGQCVLLELLFRAERGAPGILPRKVWLLDRELETWHGAIARQTAEIDVDVRPKNAATVVRPAVPRNAATQTMSTVLNGMFEPPPAKLPRIVADVVREGLTPPEWIQSIEDGFFALPRLAAAWFGTVGLERVPDFLTPAYLNIETKGNDQPLFVVGSIAGGTGAGLLPSLLHALRLSEPTLWKREVWFFPFLPYFDPHAGKQADKKIDLAQCRWNASHAIQELAREHSLIETRTEAAIPELADRNNVPLTAISFIPPMAANPNDLVNVSPPDPQVVCNRKSFDGAIGRGVDHLLAVDAYRSNPQKHIADNVERRIHIGVMQVPDEHRATSARPRLEPYVGGRRNAVVAEMTRVLHEALRATRDGARVIPGVVAGHGLGETLNEILHAQTLSSAKGRRARNTDFWRRFDARIDHRRETLAGPLEALHTAQDVDDIIAILDASWRDGEHRARRLLAPADANDDAAGTTVADRIMDALLGAKEGESRNILVATPADSFVPAAGVEGFATTTFAQIPAFGEFSASEEAAASLASRWRPADDPHALHGSSRAKLMGHAHAFAAYVRSAPVAGGAPGIHSPIGVAWLLWQAAVAGLLTFEEFRIEKSNPPERWHEAEDWDADFGGHLNLISFDGVVVGFSSADMGIVPAAQLSDRATDAAWQPNGDAAEALVRLEKAVGRVHQERRDQNRDSIAAILHDFVRLRATGPAVPWAKTLSYEGMPGDQTPAGTVLRRSAIPAHRLWLRPAPGAPPVEMQIPLVLDDLDAIRKVAYGPVVVDDDAEDALLVLTGDALQYQEGFYAIHVLTLGSHGAGNGKRSVASVDVENLRRAASALPPAPPRDARVSAPPLFQLDWE